MKALVYTGPHAMEIRDVAEPAPLSGGEVLLRIDACGICGSDMHAWHGRDSRRPAPLILGHEAVGTIAAGEWAGTRVTVNPLVACQTCEACVSGRENLCAERQIISMPPREGAFAQHLIIPERNVIAVPEHVAPTKATLVEPLACGWHAVRLAEHVLSKPLGEARIVVLGGGAIGLGAALVARHKGATDIWLAETNVRRHAALARAGNFHVFDPMSKQGAEPGTADLVIDAVGSVATRAAACAAVRAGGVIAHVGLGEASGGLDVRRMTLHEITFIGTYTYALRDFRDTAQALFDGHLGPLDWIDVRPLSDGPQAFREIDSGEAGAPKIILEP